MMSFCKKSVHSLLVLTNHPMNVISIDNGNISSNEKPSCKCQGVCNNSLPGGLGLITAASDYIHKTPNILESTTIKSSPSSTPPSSPPPPSNLFKKDPGWIGFIDDIGGGVNGLMSCTESLGFESSDERRVDDDIDFCSRERSSVNKIKWRKFGERKEVKKFPPPLSSLNHNGQPNFFLKPVRKDGRLELTEIRIDRPEILRASRQDGRLRLHLIRDEEFDVEEDGNEQEIQEELIEQKEEEREEEVKEHMIEKEEKEKEEIVEEWGFQVTGDGFRRCHEVVAHHHDYNHHHHNLHVWSQHCVTTR